MARRGCRARSSPRMWLTLRLRRFARRLSPQRLIYRLRVDAIEVRGRLAKILDEQASGDWALVWDGPNVRAKEKGWFPTRFIGRVKNLPDGSEVVGEFRPSRLYRMMFPVYVTILSPFLCIAILSPLIALVAVSRGAYFSAGAVLLVPPFVSIHVWVYLWPRLRSAHAEERLMRVIVDALDRL
jgi:hypothetical protein